MGSAKVANNHCEQTWQHNRLFYFFLSLFLAGDILASAVPCYRKHGRNEYQIVSRTSSTTYTILVKM